ncbi:YHS domain-containing (seleno)protein [Oceanomicrobium pacificus]|uniref:YHS domain-containing protein n=1 Tax=Oceanomicrobium pacificus TaxID=2692916 RepID=A0A6B0TXW1_9RHOB|nr:YHS domain-containing (seleno)protein [Oceanomicrobium pacificus]MXU66132.1 YHS domain-containing protein [Oceanomicrobium pacificus]
MTLTRRAALASLTALALSTALPAHADRFFLGEDGFVIRGYDPVAYFTDGAPIKGDPQFTADWDGGTFLFASAANRDMFRADPARYVPQYGGYCAYAASKGALAKTEPDAWTIHDGKLYLNFDTQVRAIWAEDIPGNIERADANWPQLREN